MRINMMAARKEKKLTQSQLAKMVGVSLNQIAFMERGKVGGSVETWIKVRDALDAPSIDWLLEESIRKDKK